MHVLATFWPVWRSVALYTLEKAPLDTDESDGGGGIGPDSLSHLVNELETLEAFMIGHFGLCLALLLNNDLSLFRVWR